MLAKLLATMLKQNHILHLIFLPLTINRHKSLHWFWDELTFFLYRYPWVNFNICLCISILWSIQMFLFSRCASNYFFFFDIFARFIFRMKRVSLLPMVFDIVELVNAFAEVVRANDGNVYFYWVVWAIFGHSFWHSSEFDLWACIITCFLIIVSFCFAVWCRFQSKICMHCASLMTQTSPTGVIGWYAKPTIMSDAEW